MDVKQMFSNHTDVSLTIARHVSLNVLNGEGVPKNLIISPLSLNVVVSLIAAGSSGQTLEQLLSFLKSNSIDDLNKLSSEIVSVVFADGSLSGGPKLSLANAVWIQEDLNLKPSYQHVVESFYKAASYPVDFQIKAKEIISEVNSWAEKQTNGLIKEVVGEDSVDETTRLILANAIYFKGVWEHEWFNASNTKEHDFYLLGGDSVKVPFMTSEWSQYIRVFDSFKVLRLPYKKGEDRRKFSMYIYLPHSKDGLPALVDKLGSEPGFIDRHLPHIEVGVNDFRLPKFKISFGIIASDTLKELGASSAFTTGGLTEMVEDPMVGKSLYVSDVYHKAFIEVNEEGTEAAAVTVSVVSVQCLMPSPPPVDFVADHPFMFLIREDTTGAVIFIGHVLNPLKEE